LVFGKKIEELLHTFGFSSVMSIKIGFSFKGENKCSSLNLKCLPKVHRLKAWLPNLALLGGGRTFI
jgi:hypothetical protein